MEERSLAQVESETIREYIQRHIQWSVETFGEGEHLEGLLKHIEKECNEVRNEVDNASANFISEEEANKNILNELADIVILTVDAMWRQGFTPEQIAYALLEKQKINMRRKWTKITDPSQPTEHIREKE